MPYGDRMSTGLFSDRTSAERAYDDLVKRGYTADEFRNTNPAASRDVPAVATNLYKRAK